MSRSWCCGEVSGVAVATGSTAGLPSGLIGELRIHPVPQLQIQADEVFRQGVEITPTEVYCPLRAGQEQSTSAAPSIPDFLRVYQAAVQEPEGILSIYVSPELSSIYKVAVTAGHRAIELMLEQIAQPADRPMHAPVAHAEVQEKPKRIVAERCSCAEPFLAEFTPVVGARAGAGPLGIAFCSE